MEKMKIKTDKGSFLIGHEIDYSSGEEEHILVAFDGDNPVAKLFYAVEPKYSRVMIYFVRTEIAFENKGYGSALLLAVEYMCAKDKNTNLLCGLYAPVDEDCAKHFYSKNGFKIILDDSDYYYDKDSETLKPKPKIAKYVPYSAKHYKKCVYELESFESVLA